MRPASHSPPLPAALPSADSKAAPGIWPATIARSPRRYLWASAAGALIFGLASTCARARNRRHADIDKPQRAHQRRSGHGKMRVFPCAQGDGQVVGRQAGIETGPAISLDPTWQIDCNPPGMRFGKRDEQGQQVIGQGRVRPLPNRQVDQHFAVWQGFRADHRAAVETPRIARCRGCGPRAPRPPSPARRVP